MKRRVILAVPANFGGENIAHLKARLHRATGTPVQSMQVETDDTLLGGFKIYMGNHGEDASLKTRLSEVRDLLARGE